MSKIFIISKCKFPDGDATSSYYTNIGYELNKICTVTYVGMGFYNGSDDSGTFITLRNHRKNSLISKILSNVLFQQRVIKYLAKTCIYGDSIIIDGVFSKRFFGKIFKMSQKNGYYANICITEHFGNNQLLPLTPGHIIDFLNNRFLYVGLRNHFFGIIGISSHIVNLFQCKGFKTFILPFTFSSEKNQETIVKKNHDKINYIYAGNPGKKDLLFDMLSGFALLNNDDILKIQIHIVGVEKEWLKKYKGWKTIVNKLENSLVFYGKRNLEFIKELYKKMDFSILLRDPNALSSKGGFPTKICEAMFYQTTPICNLSSDLKNYLHPSNSIIVNGYDAQSFQRAIKKTINMSTDQIKTINTESKNVVNNQLSSCNYSKSILNFIFKN